MSRRPGVLFLAALALLFLATNHSAYLGFFENDDLGTLGWTPLLPWADYLKGVGSFLYQPNNFRPVGHAVYRLFDQLFGVQFPAYVAFIHGLHILNFCLLWYLARLLGASRWAAAVSTAFFALHAALFEAFWKPMYLFDVLCGTFCLLSVLAFVRRRWVWSFLAFWLAYKSKEVAVMLPAVLICYEYWFGSRKWIRVAPFFAVSLSFGLQALLLNKNNGPNYVLHASISALAATSAFYMAKVFLLPYAGFLVLPSVLVVRDKRVRFGIAAMFILFVPMLLLPGRLHGAYCYVPFAGLAVALSGIADLAPKRATAAVALAIIPLFAHEFVANSRAQRKTADEVRQWFYSVARLRARHKPLPSAVVYDGAPNGVDSFGVEGAAHYLLSPDIPVREISAPDAPSLLQNPDVALIMWNRERRKLAVSYPGNAN